MKRRFPVSSNLKSSDSIPINVENDDLQSNIGNEKSQVFGSSMLFQQPTTLQPSSSSNNENHFLFDKNLGGKVGQTRPLNRKSKTNRPSTVQSQNLNFFSQK